MTTASPPRIEHVYNPRGAARDVLECRTPEALLAGPAGTGKSRAALEKLHFMCLVNPKMRGLMVRKTLASLTSTGLVTFEQHVAQESILAGDVKWFGGSQRKPPAWQYSNGAELVVGGMDNATKIMSSEYDMIYVQEAVELTEDDWEKCTTRLRNNKVSFQQLIADCNPDAPHHWLRLRCDKGLTTEFLSRHEDNPVYFNLDGSMTEVGAAYMSKLDRLTGVRYLRLRKGIWAAAEGVIYDEFDARIHVIDRFDIPDSWERFWSIDFGYVNPFVCYDDKTEILTDQGWKRFADLDRREKVATVNMDSHAVEWQQPTNYIIQNYVGPMVTSEPRRGSANFSVTPNHRMVLENRKRGGWSIHQADEMPTGNYSIPVGWEPIEAEAGDPDFARFLGLWLADGCITWGGPGKKRQSVRIAQKSRIDEVRAVVMALNVKWTERPDRFGVVDFRIDDREFVAEVFGLCGKVRSASKRLPSVCMSWGRTALTALLEGLMLGDGSPRVRDARGQVTASRRFTTTSAQLADDVQAIASLLGMSTTRTLQMTHSGYTGKPITVYTVRFPTTSRAALTTMDIRYTAYDGKVYCVTVPNGTVIVRRGGRPMVSGNCQMWAQDPDGRLYLYREIYHTGKTVDQHARDILDEVSTVPEGVDPATCRPSQRIWHEPKPRDVVCDHDAGDRAILERDLGIGCRKATKHVTEGIQLVQARMRVQGDGKPRIFFLRDSVVRKDPELLEAHKPTCTIEELASYVWDMGNGKKVKELPLKENDHGCDALRYEAVERDSGRPRVRSMNG